MKKVFQFFLNLSKLPTFPIASRPLSNKNNIPRSRKKTPKPDRPMPISF